MIIKSFELEKLKSTKIKKILFHGENEGYKYQIINNFFIKKFSDNFEKYEENQILNNYEDFFSGLLNKSFFEKDKLLVINRASEKILKLVEEISSKFELENFERNLKKNSASKITQEIILYLITL